MLSAIQAFGEYWVCSVLIILAFAYLYIKLTPYDEVHLIKKGMIEPALTLCGALIGFTLPLYAVILHTGHLKEMILWAVFSGLVQVVAYQLVRLTFGDIHTNIIEKKNGLPLAIVLGTLSIILGLITAACVTP